MKEITGGVTAAKGFQAASTAAGIKYRRAVSADRIFHTRYKRLGIIRRRTKS